MQYTMASTPNSEPIYEKVVAALQESLQPEFSKSEDHKLAIVMALLKVGADSFTVMLRDGFKNEKVKDRADQVFSDMFEEVCSCLIQAVKEVEN